MTGKAMDKYFSKIRSFGALKLILLTVSSNIVLFMIILSIALWSINDIEKSSIRSLKYYVEPTNILTNLRYDIINIPYRLSMYLSDQYPAVGTQNKLKEVKLNIHNLWEKYYQIEKHKITSNIIKDEEILSVLEETNKTVQEVDKFFSDSLSALESEDQDLVLELLEDEWPDYQEGLSNNIEKLLNLNQNGLSKNTNSIIAVSKFTFTFLSSLALLAILFSLGLIFYIIKMRKKVGDKILELISISENNMKGSNFLTESAKDLAGSASDQSASIQESVASMIQLKGMVKQTSNYSQHSKDFAQDVSQKSHDGLEVMNSLNEKMAELEGSVNNISDSVESMGKIIDNKVDDISNMIEEISQEISVINDIVTKTQLLSINASIEADRAGEFGKGFSAVAHEVGNLARLTGHAAKKINILVKNSKNNVKSITKTISTQVEIVHDKAGDGKKVTKSLLETNEFINKIFHEINTQINNIITNTSEVFNATIEQGKGLEQISESMTVLQTTTEKNSVNAEDNLREAENLRSKAFMLERIEEEFSNDLIGNKSKKISVQQGQKQDETV